MESREVIVRCLQLGVPIFHGRIDRTLFLFSMKAQQRRTEPRSA